MPLKDRYVMRKLNRKTIGRNYLELYLREAITLEVTYKDDSLIIAIEDGKLHFEKSKTKTTI